MRILITGANGAMAQETIKQLIKKGHTDIVMAVRDKSKGEDVWREFTTHVGRRGEQ